MRALRGYIAGVTLPSPSLSAYIPSAAPRDPLAKSIFSYLCTTEAPVSNHLPFYSIYTIATSTMSDPIQGSRQEIAPDGNPRTDEHIPEPSTKTTHSKAPETVTSDEIDHLFRSEATFEQPTTTRKELWSYYLYYNGNPRRTSSTIPTNYNPSRRQRRRTRLIHASPVTRPPHATRTLH